MCGIIGYVGNRSAEAAVVEGLRRMEYRGYDSAGIALVAGDTLRVQKKAGKLANLEKLLSEQPLPASTIAMGHTRWATHGGPTDRNAHPHVGRHGRVAVVHNGIIENFAELRRQLEDRGHHFSSDTDTEIAAHLVELEVEKGLSVEDALRTVAKQLVGSFTLLAMDAQQPDTIAATRRNSPLVVGLGEGENFLGSDVAAFIEFTRNALELEQDQVVAIRADSVSVTDLDGNPAAGKPFVVTWDLSAAQKDGYDWFMRKEIFEQPKAVADALLGRRGADGQLALDEMRLSDQDVRDIDKIIIIACGTSFYAGMVAKYAIEHWCRIPVEVELSSEFRYRDPILDNGTLVVAISQSGETADTLQAIRHARVQKSKVLAICNTNGSTIPRESDAVIYTHAGPEIGVASTKGFLTQLVACYLLGLYLAQVRGVKFDDEIARILDQLDGIPAAIESVLADSESIYAVARKHVSTKSVLFLGRHAGYPVALEGALKLKELAYIHAEGFAAGELKHGPIALVEEGLPIFCVIPPRGRDQLHEKMISGIQEVRARGARTICLAEVDDELIKPYADTLITLPKVPVLLQPLVATVPLQLFACELATAMGHDVDMPRNLAKSVTVE